MAKEYVMPKLAMAMNEGTISEWLVKHGEKVEKAQPLASIETEKVTYDVESPEAGYLCLLLQEGETAPCEQLIAYFCDSAEEVTSMAESSAPSPTVENAAPAAAPASLTTAAPTSPVPVRAAGERIIASPLARKISRDNGLDLALVAGTGPNSRIVKRDVLAAIERGLHQATALAAVPTGGTRELARIPMKGLRKTIADRMLQSLQTAAQLSSVWESDITDLLAARQKFVGRAEQLGTKVSVNTFIIKAIAYAVKQVPIANACLEGDEIVIYDNINMGIAISKSGTTPYDSSLVVAVLRNIERMGLVDIDKAMKALISRVRNDEATPEDLTGSTITLSSTAGIAPAGLQATPVLNLPNLALVGPSTPKQKPAVYNGEIVARTIMPMSFTFDHRGLDGEPASRFMKALHEALENPELMLA